MRNYLSSLDVIFSRNLMVSVTNQVREHFPETKIREAWVYKVGRDHWEFHGPDDFYWHGSAGNAYDARAHGWLSWLRSRGIE